MVHGVTCFLTHGITVEQEDPVSLSIPLLHHVERMRAIKVGIALHGGERRHMTSHS